MRGSGEWIASVPKSLAPRSACGQRPVAGFRRRQILTNDSVQHKRSLNLPFRGSLPPHRPRMNLVARLQCTRDRFSDIAADEGFTEDIDDPCGLRSFAQLRPTIAAHEYD